MFPLAQLQQAYNLQEVKVAFARLRILIHPDKCRSRSERAVGEYTAAMASVNDARATLRNYIAVLS